MTLGVEKDVGRLDVSVHHVAHVQKGEGEQGVVDYFDQVMFCKVNLVLHKLIQIGFNVFHYNAQLT